MTFCFGAIKMNEEVNLVLPKSSPYQCDLDFVLIEDSDRFAGKAQAIAKAIIAALRTIAGLRTLLPMLFFDFRLLMEKMLQQP